MSDSDKKTQVDSFGQSVESKVLTLITTTTAELARTYERLKWLGFLAVVGALLIVASLVLPLIPGLTLVLKQQILFVSTGFGMLLLSAGLYVLQNVHAFRLEGRNRDMAIRSLELKYDLDRAITLKPAELVKGEYRPPSGG